MRRRDFLATSAATAAAATGGRIDVQSHLYAPEMLRYLEKRKSPPQAYRKGADLFVVVGEWHRRVLPKHTDVEAKLADMDAAGIELTALSINDPGPELFGKEGPALARMLNDFVAGVSKRHPRRFFGLMTLPLQDMEAAGSEMERCAAMGMKGVLLYSNLDGRFPDEPPFRSVFAWAERLDLPILLHPAYPLTYDAVKGYEMAGGLGLMFDTTIALTRIILAGILDQHPKLRLLCPHVGGALPYLVGRIDHQTQVLKRGAENIRRPPSEYLRQIWLDSVSPIALAIRYGYDFVGPDRLLYASDHPWVDPQLIAAKIVELKLPAADNQKIFRENARRFFKL
jgi:predicted TIM-barrel fold metal-dependent hydrolase